MDRPKSLGIEDNRVSRFKELHEPHIKPLTDFVEALRIETGPEAAIPYFDPWDGGINSEVLFLLEAPGPKSVVSGFISRNNPDETAKNVFELCSEAGLKRSQTILWNVVPWYIGSGKKIRPARSADIQVGLKPLPRLLTFLPLLKAIVLLGRKAEKAMKQIDQSRYRVFVSPHPSPLFVNNAPGNRDKLLSVLHEVRMFLEARPHD